MQSQEVFVKKNLNTAGSGSTAAGTGMAQTHSQGFKTFGGVANGPFQNYMGDDVRGKSNIKKMIRAAASRPGFGQNC